MTAVDYQLVSVVDHEGFKVAGYQLAYAHD